MTDTLEAESILRMSYNKDPNSFERSLLYDILSANVHDEIVEL